MEICPGILRTAVVENRLAYACPFGDLAYPLLWLSGGDRWNGGRIFMHCTVRSAYRLYISHGKGAEKEFYG